MKRVFLIFKILIILCLTESVQAEPTYCSPLQFKNLELKKYSGDLSRLRVFKVGSVYLTGLAIGSEDANDVAAFIDGLAAETKTVIDSKYCAFYFHKRNRLATTTFHHRYFNNPRDIRGNPTTTPAEQTAREYIEGFGEISERLFACAEMKNITMGCSLMKHRGPTIFGMLLAYSGCTVENSERIVNEVWGENGVPNENRRAAYRQAFALGSAEFENRQRLQILFKE